MPNTAVFRADASVRVGGGHVLRCLALADTLASRGWRVLFACSPETPRTVTKLSRSCHGVKILSGTASSVQRTMRDLLAGSDLLVVDSYEIDTSQEEEWARYTKKVMVLDDLPAKPHHCHLLLDQTLGRMPSHYADLVPADCVVLTGPRHALLRAEFARLREASTKRVRPGHAPRVLISFGLTDVGSATLYTLKAVAGMASPFEIDVLVGSAAQDRTAIQGEAARLGKRARVHQDVEDVAGLLCKADICIGAGGSSSWERCALGVPSLIISVADNQRLIAAELDRVRAAVYLGPREAVAPKQITDALTRLIGGAELGAMSTKAASICDGLGAIRVAEAIDGLIMK